MSVSPSRPHRKAQVPRAAPSQPPFKPFAVPVETASMARPHHAANLVESGSCVEHPSLRIFTCFGPESEDFKRAPLINRSPRYPLEADLIRSYRNEQLKLLDVHAATEPLPPPPASRFVLPYPTGLLTSPPGSARGVYNIMRVSKESSRVSTAQTATSTRTHSPLQTSPQQSPRPGMSLAAVVLPAAPSPVSSPVKRSSPPMPENGEWDKESFTSGVSRRTPHGGFLPHIQNESPRKRKHLVAVGLDRIAVASPQGTVVTPRRDDSEA